MSNLECAVKLPSSGKPYSDEALAGDIILRMISGKVEKKIFGSTVPNVLDYLLNECIVSPKFDVSTLTLEDRHFLLTKLRIHSYGDDYHYRGTCPHCGQIKEFPYSLDDVEVTELTEEYKDTWEVELPVTEDTIVLRNLRAGDYTKIQNRVNKLAKQAKVSKDEQDYLTSLAFPIVSINGEQKFITEVENYIDNLPAKDILAIRKALNKYSYGFSTTVFLTCPVCGGEFNAPVTITSEFFRPDTVLSV